MLTSMYGWFVEGFDTPDLKDACALIRRVEEKPVDLRVAALVLTADINPV